MQNELATVLAPAALRAENLLRNGRFEVGTCGWTWFTGCACDWPGDFPVRTAVDRKTAVAVGSGLNHRGHPENGFERNIP